MAEIFLPTLHTFAMDNKFTGSFGELRFKIKPTVVQSQVNPKEVDMEQSSMFVEYWHGPFCYEKSEIEGSATFPMSEEGRLSLKSWLEAQI